MLGQMQKQEIEIKPDGNSLTPTHQLTGLLFIINNLVFTT